jgi:hypothetical protein
LPTAEQWRIIISERGEEIVGFCCIFAGAHLEPWYVAPSHRRNPAVARGLLRESKQLLDDLGIESVFATVSDALPEQQAIVERLGFTPAPGRLYVLNVADLEV